MPRAAVTANSALASLGRYWRDSRPRHCSRADIPAWRPQKSHYCIIVTSDITPSVKISALLHHVENIWKTQLKLKQASDLLVPYLCLIWNEYGHDLCKHAIVCQKRASIGPMLDSSPVLAPNGMSSQGRRAIMGTLFQYCRYATQNQQCSILKTQFSTDI